MQAYPTEKIRNVALVGHAGSGKTTLAEALLFRAGAINRLGSIEDGNTVCDFDPEEHSRTMSLSLSLAPFEWRGFKINLIDTPGSIDFVGDVYAALHVADLAVFVVNAVDGVEVQTQTIWRIAEELNVPRMVFVNKLDKERASFQRTLDALRERFGAGIAPLELPIGEEAGFHGVADLLTDTAYIYDSGHSEKAPIPEEMEELEHRVHDNLIEGIVVADDELLEKYLEGDTPTLEELERTLATGVDAATVFPVVCGSATGPIAVDRLADFIVEIGPAPADRPPFEVVAGDGLVELKPDSSADPLVYVFKTFADDYVGQLSVFRVMTGIVQPDQRLTNSRTGNEERLHKLVTLRGKEQIDLPSVAAGDIGVVAKLADTRSGDTLAPKTMPVSIELPVAPIGLLPVALVPETQADSDKLPTALRRLEAEDPALRIEQHPETGQTLLWGGGETHVQVTLDKLRRKFGISIGTEDVRVPYRWTLTRRVDAEGKYKKQSGGHGQFGIARVVFEPIERGAGYRFEDKVVGGAIPRQFIPAVEKGIGEALAEGAKWGYPIVDVQASCVGGKYHSVDSSEMSFKMAGKLATRAALEEGAPVLLEPVSVVEITVPPEMQGDIMRDLSTKRGRVQSTLTNERGDHVITAEVPTAEVLRYAVDLVSITGGAGKFTRRHNHYAEMPSHLMAMAAVEDDD